MATNCEYLIYDIFDKFLRDIEQNIFLSSYSPYPVYNNIEDFINDTTSEYKGLLIYDVIKYYLGDIIKEIRDNYDIYPDFFIIVEYGDIQIRNNFEYYQNLLISVDSYYSRDKYGTKQLKIINYIVNRYRELYEKSSGYYISGVNIYTKLFKISNIIINEKYNQYFRRSINFWIRYCVC